MKKKILIFDLDGTLLNTLEDLTDSTNRTLSEFGFPSRTIEDIKNFVGNGVSKLIERAIPEGKSNSKFYDCLNFFKIYYSKNMNNKTEPYVGIIPVLEQVRAKGIKIVVVSNKFDDAVKKICHKYFRNLIDYAIGENEDSGIRKKPYPDMVFEILKNYTMQGDDALFIGDSEVDIQTAKNAKIDCISVSWGFKTEDFLKNSGAKIIINTPEEILKYL